MNLRKSLLWTAVVCAGAGLFSAGIFSAEKTAPETLTLEQAKAKGMSAHTFPRQHNALVGEDGIKYLAYDTGKGYQLFVVEKDKKVTAKNGIFKLKGGGSVKVKDGWIIWSDSTINSRFPHQGYTSGVIGLG